MKPCDKRGLGEAKKSTGWAVFERHESSPHFVRALLNDPKSSFSMKPTNGLDPANARVIQRYNLDEAEGKTILFRPI